MVGGSETYIQDGHHYPIPEQVARPFFPADDGEDDQQQELHGFYIGCRGMEVKKRGNGKHDHKGRNDVAGGQVFKAQVLNSRHGFESFEGAYVAVYPEKEQQADEQEEESFVATVFKIISKGFLLSFICFAKGGPGAFGEIGGIFFPEVIVFLAKDAGGRGIEQGIYFFQ